MILTRACLPVALAGVTGLATAQPLPPTPASVEACQAIELDAQRLACYDAATGRQARPTEVADSEAARARALKDDPAVRADAMAVPEPERRDLYAHDAYGRIDDAIANAGQGSLLDTRWELAKDSKLGVFNLRAYKPVYLLPAFWTSDKNQTPSSPNPDNTVTTPQALDSLEAKFQLSFKTKAVENLFGTNGDIWMGYTQSSRWQVYNTENSRPFRETNYEPEVLMVFRNGYSIGGWNGRMAAVGINHQSNGRGDPLSRSWNRVMFNVGLDRENWAVMFRPWVRISDGSDDDNPDIEDFMGRGDVTLTHVRGGHVYTLMARHSLRGGDRSNGALQFDWGFPIHRNFRGHLQVFNGYGESLIDYNHKATYVGLGISLLDWF